MSACGLHPPSFVYPSWFAETLPGHLDPRARQAWEIARLMNKASGEDVFFLPGKIDIRRVEQLRQVESSGTNQGGRTLMTRCVVRGHYRRPNPTWKDLRIRWIEPYWKGPELATVIDREYRLRD